MQPEQPPGQKPGQPPGGCTATTDGNGIEWLHSDRPVLYEPAVEWMQQRSHAIRTQAAPETVWLLSHPPLITAGTGTTDAEIQALDPRIPFRRSPRGGRLTWHGPGQRVAYVMLDLGRRRRDVRGFVGCLCAWVAASLSHFGLEAAPRSDRIGLWLARPGGSEDKIAALGVRISRWVSSHGVAINIDPPPAAFLGFHPCGIDRPGLGVTSMAQELPGRPPALLEAQLDQALRAESGRLAGFGRDRPEADRTPS